MISPWIFAQPFSTTWAWGPPSSKLVERFTAQTGVEVDQVHSGLDVRLPPDIERAAYRIAHEALTNVARHAGVSRAALR